MTAAISAPEPVQAGVPPISIGDPLLQYAHKESYLGTDLLTYLEQKKAERRGL